jgi:hypothetical protein
MSRRIREHGRMMQDNPYKAGAAAPRYVMQPERPSPTITVFAALNFVLAGLCAVWLLCVAGMLVYGIGFSGDEGQELAAGVVGCLVIGLPGLLGLAVYAVAGWGLMRRQAWGFYFHFVGAVLAALTCVGVIYTVMAIVFALRPEFSAVFFPSGAARSSATPPMN